MTWLEHCTNYTPGEYARDLTQRNVDRACDELSAILDRALAHLDITARLGPTQILLADELMHSRHTTKSQIRPLTPHSQQRSQSRHPRQLRSA